MTQATREETVAEVWESYWQGKQGEVQEWDLLSSLILSRLLHEIGDLRGKTVCEAGCGTGRISHRLHQAGADVTCLDITQSALDLSRRVIGDGPGTRFVRGSILDMPMSGELDFIWNAGVMEHFTPDLQQQALREFAKALKPGGRALLLTPYSFSGPYRLAKWLMERTNKWPYGPEVPVTTLADVTPPELTLLREYTVTFFPFFTDADKIVGSLKPICAPLRRVAFGLAPATLRRVDRVFSATFGGYLLLSVLERPT